MDTHKLLNKIIKNNKQIIKSNKAEMKSIKRDNKKFDDDFEAMERNINKRLNSKVR